MKNFKFERKQGVIINESGERGIIIGCADYAHAECRYLVRYKAGDGRAVENWWTETALTAI